MPAPDRPQYLKTLAAFCADTSLATLGPAVVERARWIIADSLPVIAAGMQVPEMKALVSSHLKDSSSGTAWVFGAGGRKASAIDAALLNGTAGTWLELDEGNLFAKGHPGIQVVPAAVAAAQESAAQGAVALGLGASGADLLVAVALGYEVSSRIHRAANVKLAVHPHGTYGVIGAALAVGKLRGFDADRMLELINVSATMGMTTSRQTLLDGATVRNIYTGHSGYMGTMAARLVESGFTGEIDSVSAIYGKILSDTFDPDLVVRDLGHDWLITQSYFKLHPTGRYVHSAIDALEDLLARVPGGRLDPAAIERLEVRAYMLAAMLQEKSVRTSFGARFSVPFALASILVRGRSGLASFDDAAVANPEIQNLAKRIELREEPSFTARYPAEQPVALRATMRDGSVHEGHCTITKGEPGKPHTAADLGGKFFELGVPIWGEATTRALFDGLTRLETIANFETFAGPLAL
ncbi:MmgE/PrpD family protein [soil metagenome]